MHAHLRSGGQAALPKPVGSQLKPDLYGSDYKEHLSPLLLETESASLFNSKVNIWFYFRIFLLSGARKL